MSWKNFLKGKLGVVFSVLLVVVSMWLLGVAFKVQAEYSIAVMVLVFGLVATNLITEFWQKRRFYNDFLGKLEELDQKYLITEMIQNPEFPEGEILYEALYEIDKSMKERINQSEDAQKEFKEYVELWIHEIKIPIATLSCMNYNENWDAKQQKKQIDRLNYYVEQILFLSRADHPQKDYLMKKVSLETTVNQVIKNNKELLRGNRIRIEKDTLQPVVMSDAKWLEFIIGQIVNNSVKYSTQSGVISFETFEEKNKSELVITDNGIGICSQDLPRVFEKTFTGENGRKITGSTGMGLYICRKLCQKLGHKIWVESKQGEYTKVHLEFGKDTYYQM